MVQRVGQVVDPEVKTEQEDPSEKSCYYFEPEESIFSTCFGYQCLAFFFSIIAFGLRMESVHDNCERLGIRLFHRHRKDIALS